MDKQEGERRLSNLKERLNAKNIYELRQLGRAVGLANATDKKKDVLIADILEVAQGNYSAPDRGFRGAPPKSRDYDQNLAQLIFACRDCFLNETTGDKSNSQTENKKPDLTVHSSSLKEILGQKIKKAENYSIFEEPSPYGIEHHQKICLSGVADFDGEKWVMACFDNRGGNVRLALIPLKLAESYGLQMGDHLEGVLEADEYSQFFTVESIKNVNGQPAVKQTETSTQEGLTFHYTPRRFALGNDDVGMKLINLMAPVASGQRVILSAPPKSGKTSLLLSLAKSLAANNQNLALVALPVGCQSEDAVQYYALCDEKNVFFSSFDQGAENHILAAKYAADRAVRLLKDGKSVVLLVDCINTLARAYSEMNDENSNKKSENSRLSGELKKLFNLACNCRNGGSITVVAAVEYGTGNGFDDNIYRVFHSAASCEIALTQELAKRHCYPAIDCLNCGTRQEEKFLTAQELNLSHKLRECLCSGMNVRKPSEFMRECESLEQLNVKLDEWIEKSTV